MYSTQIFFVLMSMNPHTISQEISDYMALLKEIDDKSGKKKVGSTKEGSDMCTYTGSEFFHRKSDDGINNGESGELKIV
jgi:hypothetical protein